MKFALFFLLLLTGCSLGAADEPVEPPDEMPDLAGLFGLLVALCLPVVALVIAFTLAGVALGSALALVALGLVSSATLVGLLQRRPSSGLRVLHYEVCALVGVALCPSVLWLGAHWLEWPLAHRDLFLFGTISGLGGGLLVAFCFDRLAGVFLRRVVLPPFGR